MRKIPAVFPPKFASNGWLIIHLAGSNMQEHGARRARSDDGRLTILPLTRIDGTLFVHGGLGAEYSKFSLQEINRRVRNAMAAGDDGQATILYDPLGPLWYRGLVIPDADAEAERATSRSEDGSPQC